MIQKLKKELDTIIIDYKTTTVDSYQFEKNVRIDYKADIITGHLELLKKHKGFIGNKVYKYVNNFKFSDDLHGQNTLNKLESTSKKFTMLMYAQFEINLASFFVDRLTYDLLENTLFKNSTNKLSNLKHQWIIESKQELLKLYKSFLPQEGTMVKKTNKFNICTTKLSFMEWMEIATLYDENGFYIYRKELWTINQLEEIHYKEYLKL